MLNPKDNCAYSAFTDGTCCTGNTCCSETAHIQIIVDRAPLIRPERQDIKTVIAFGVLVAMLAFGGAHILNHYEKQAEYAGRV